MKLEILYEDDYCLVVNKPSDLIIHHSSFARNIVEISLVDLLRIQTVNPELSPAHRLDRKTSGLVLFVKAKEQVARFQEVLTQEESKKIYWALVRGHLPEKGFIDSPVKNERGTYKEAFTAYKCLLQLERDFTIPPYPQQRYSLAEFSPKTGRYHQLRQHANKIAHPIINDPKHGNRHHNHYFGEVLGISHLFLHARTLNFEHPFLGKQISVSAPLPNFWQEFLGNELIDLLQ